MSPDGVALETTDRPGAANDASLRRDVSWYSLYALLSKLLFSRGVFLLFLADRGMSSAQIGTIQACFFFANVAAELPTGAYGDRHGRKRSVMIGLAMMSASALGMVVFRGFVAYAIMFLIDGVALAFVSGSDVALLYETFKQRGFEGRYAGAYGKIRALEAAALSAAIALGGFLAWIRWSVVYIASAVVLALALLAMWRVKDLSPPPEPAQGETNAAARPGFRAFFGSREGRWLLVLMMALGIFEAAVTPYFIFGQLLFASLGLSSRSIGVTMSVAELIPAFMYAAISRFASRLRTDKVVYVVMASIALLLPLNALRLFPVSLAVFLVIATIPAAQHVVINDFLQQRVPSDIRATSLSLVSLMQSCFVGLAYIGYGKAIDRVPISTGFSWAAIIPLAALALCFLCFRNLSREEVSP